MKSIILLTLSLLTIMFTAQAAKGQDFIYQIAHGTGTAVGSNGEVDFIIGQYIHKMDTVGSLAVGFLDIVVITNDINTTTRNIPSEMTNFSVFPNPAQNHLVVEVDAMDNFSDQLFLKIYDVTGAVLYQEKWQVNPGKNSTTINIQNYASATYFLALENQNGGNLKTYKVIKR